jgi:uncharacterized protein (TIGR03083 family)
MRDAVGLGLEELSRMLELLRGLPEDAWARPTDCTGWDVHDVVAHVVGQFEGAARPDRLLRRVRAAKRLPGFGVLDGHNELQVRERKHLRPEELVEQLEGWGGRGIRGLARIPAPLRRMRLSRIFPEAVEMPDDSLDFLIRIIGPRDPWMHRIDVCTAVGRELVPDGHDALIVEQVVGDLERVWGGQAVKLVLEGPAGGEWIVGQGSPVAEVRCDAIDYCRHVSGRPAPPAEVTGEHSVGEALLAVKISF